MYINQSITAQTVQLFKTTAQPGAGAAQSDRASVFTPSKEIDMQGIYSDPRLAQPLRVELSPKTQEILGTIQSLVENVLPAIKTRVAEMASEELGRDVPPDFSMTKDLSTSDRMTLSSETRAANVFWMKLGFMSGLATMSEAMLSSGIRSLAFGEQYAGMSDDELIEAQIETLVDMQINNIQMVREMQQSDEYKSLSQGADISESSVPDLSGEDITALRQDLLAKRWDDFHNGKLNIQVTFYASTHAGNYGRAYKTLDMSTGEVTAQAENTVAFDEAWEFNAQRKEQFAQMFDGAAGDQILEGLGTYAEDYMKDVYANG